MILDIYKLMLNIAKDVKSPKYVTHIFNISEEESSNFWKDISLNREHELLMEEWDPESGGLYTKTFYGIEFSIQFNYSKEK